MKPAPGFTEGPPRTFVPVVRAPWMFPFQAGIAGYREVTNGDTRPICLVTGERIERDVNTGTDRRKP